MSFPLPDPGDAFVPPLGTPGTLGTAATSLGTAATSLTQDITTAKNAVATATSNWRGPRTQEFKDGILGPQLELAETMAAVKEVGVLVGELATALTTATSKVSEAAGRYHQLARKYAGGGTIDPLELLADKVRAAQDIGDARSAKSDYHSTASRLAGEIDAQTNRLVPGGSTLTPAAIAQRVAESTGVAGIDAGNPSAADAWKVLKAGAAHATAIESLSGDGDNTGNLAGGPYSSLPTDVDALAAMREAMLADGVTGQQLRAVTEQYWVAHAARSAGIDLDQWDPSFDAKGNAQVIPAVYKFYGELYLKNPNLKWAGLANIVGPIFAAGFDDLGDIHQLTDTLANLPDPIKQILPPEIRQVIEAGGQLSSAEVKYFEDTFLAMQKHIFMDIGSQHEAYATEGMQGIQQMYSSGAITPDMMQAWTDVDSGIPSRIDASATAFANREQNVVIAGQYDQMHDHDGALGAAFTYLMTAAGGTAVPGSLTPAEYSHLGGQATVKGGWGPFHTEAHVDVDTPLPSWNIADREDRWKYISQDILPKYLAMSPDQVRAVINTPVEQRIDSQRLVNRIPTLIANVSNETHVDGGAHVSVGPIPIGGIDVTHIPGTPIPIVLP